MKTRGVVVGVLACLVLAGCGESTGTGASYGDPFRLPVGPTEWDTSAPAWLHEGTLHVGDRTVQLGSQVDQFVLGATGVYWMSGATLMFTAADGATQEVEDVRWGNLAVSADRTVFATVDQSRGPTDEYGTHVLQLAVFDTRTGEQLYRTPDEKPDDGDDLADLYGEIMPLLHGVGNDLVFFDGSTIDLDDGSPTPSTTDKDYQEVYPGYDETLFPEGYRVSIRGEGRRRELSESSMYGYGLLSPDRNTIFDMGVRPSVAVAYDAATGRQRRIDAPWHHFTLVGWSDDDTFFGVAEHIVDDHPDNAVRAKQVVSCELRTLDCTPVSPVIPTEDDGAGRFPAFLVEGSGNSW